MNNNVLNNIFDHLARGCCYGRMFTACRYPFFDAVLKVNPVHPDMLFYQHFGSSSVRSSKANLRWVIETIFGMTPAEFARVYECREPGEMNKGTPADLNLYKIVYYDTEHAAVHSEIVEVESYGKAREIAVKRLYRNADYKSFNVFFE